MGYLSIKQTSEKWNLSARWINDLCIEGRIPGAIKIGSYWAYKNNGGVIMADYVELDIYQIELDTSNPRIANYLEYYSEDSLDSDTMALLLGTSSDSCASLRESIKENGGIVHPIIVNHFIDGRYVVVEGNTRLQIYRDFSKKNVPGNWTTIKAIVHENLDDATMNSFRIQADLVGP